MPPSLGRAPIMETETQLTDTELLARLFRVLGDASRLRILGLLAGAGELHQTEIVRVLGLSQARASEHLACLVWCGFVETRLEGRRTYYRINDPAVGQLTDLGDDFLARNQAVIASCRRIDEGTS